MSRNMSFRIRSISALLVLALVISMVPLDVSAENNSVSNTSADRVVVVSLGDSYSAGEGIEPFYGQEKALAERVLDNDWLAHRSTKSWPSLLKIPGTSGTTGESRVGYADQLSDIEWYFAAVSGAETKHFNSKQGKPYYKKTGWGSDPLTDDSKKLPAQKDIFDGLTGNVDYVTLTMGGNDVGFANIVFLCAKNSAYLHFGKTTELEDNLNDMWDDFDTIKTNLVNYYKDVQEAAGSQAEIIVAGYPKLFDKNGKGTLINKKEATLVNSNVTKFNEKIEEMINDCREDGMNIHFVDVEAEFDKDGGHGAYSSNAWINKIMLGTEDQDLNDKEMYSAYSIHPNEEGAKAYARCVNAKIQEIEDSKKGTLSGKICKASDRTTPVADATIHVISDNSTTSFTPDGNGNYSIDLPVGTYLVKVTADGYIEFNAFATIEEQQTVYMETFLMVEGEETDIGEAIGTITNALTGNGVEGVTLDVRSGWNNTDSGEILTTVTTNASGDYTVTLPIGNYTLCASKAGYISTTINVVVQPNVCTTKNASMTPIISGDNFRIVLTWGASPSDLDSHVAGTLSSGSSFHVYYGDKSEYDGDVEVCNLDVDDTTSYGPETITLNTVTNDPYYYYIYNYSSSTGMITSEAQIKVYQGENLVATFNVPTNQSDARYWNVFAIVNGELIVSNTITSSADLSYANTFSEVNALAIDAEVDVEADMLASPKENTEAEPQSETEPVAETDLQIETEPVVETEPTA